MPTDRGPELQDVEDLWPLIAPGVLPAAWMAAEIISRLAMNEDTKAEAMVGAMEEKFRRGEAEHGRDWLSMSRKQLEREVYQEIQDLFIYLSMIQVRFGD